MIDDSGILFAKRLFFSKLLMSKTVMKTVQCSQRSMQSTSFFGSAPVKDGKENRARKPETSPAPKESRNISHRIRLNSRRPLDAEHMAHVLASLPVRVHNSTTLRPQRHELPGGETIHSRPLITSFREKLVTRRCGRWEGRDCLLFLGSKFCLVSFEITGGTC